MLKQNTTKVNLQVEKTKIEVEKSKEKALKELAKQPVADLEKLVKAMKNPVLKQMFKNYKI